MYHGTPNAGFTEFRSGSYFTQNRTYAEVYQSPSASSLSSDKTITNPDVYAVYLNIKKPFDTRKPDVKKIFYDEYYRQYGMGTDLMESGLPDWMDGPDLQEFIEEMGYDFDGLILDEGGTGGYGEEVISRGLAYITFSPEQVKNISNEHPTDDPDIRFSMKAPTEETDRFIALHNMSEEALRGALELGGMAMPSVAMVRAESGHDTYGEISAVFGKNSVSPTDKRNRIFSGDAYTPTFPEIGYKISEKASNRLRDKINGLLDAAGVPQGKLRPSFDQDNGRDKIARWGSFAEAYKDEDGMQLAFLQDTGRKVVVPMQEKVYTDMADLRTLREIARNLPLAKAYEQGNEAVMAMEPQIRQYIRNYAIKKYGLDIADKLYPANEALSWSQVDKVIYAARNLERSGETKQIDSKKLGQRIETAMRGKKTQAEYMDWLRSMGDGFVERRGIRNNRDVFTPYGNRRSFDQLYYNYSLANIV